MTLLEIALACALAAIGWLVWSSLRAREAANDAMRAVCQRYGYLFLDDTVALSSLWPVRDDDGHVALRRVFTFDYSDTGHRRCSGSVTVVGATVGDVRLDAAPASDAAPR